jgi:small subunit ribosomal protein S35
VLTQRAEFAKPYAPPAADAVLRVRSHHYQGEAHPAARKAVLTVRVSDLLRIQALDSDAAAHKLRLLAGTRYEAPSGRHAEGSLKIACERFPHEAQNLRWVAERVQLLCKEANVSQTLGSMRRGGRRKAGAARAGARTQVLRPAAPQEMVASSERID